MPSISAIVSTLIYGLQSAPVNNLDFWDSPCLALASEGPVEPRGINEMIDDLLTRIDGVKFLSQQLKEYVSSWFIIVHDVITVKPVLSDHPFR